MSTEVQTSRERPSWPGVWLALTRFSALMLAVATIVISDRYLGTLRFDLTADGRHSLSPETQAVLESIEEPIRLSLFYAQDIGQRLPAVARHAARVRDLLAEYEARAGGRLIVDVFNPTPFSDAENNAVARGLLALSAGDADDALYFGLVGTNSVDDEEVIPFLSPDQLPSLEYELSSLIRSLATPRLPVLGILSGLPLQGDNDGAPQAILEALGDRFDVRNLDDDGLADLADVDSLLIAHPDTMPMAAWYAVDQFILSGRPATLLPDPFSELEVSRRTRREAFAPAGSTLGPLAASLGVRMTPRVVVGDPTLAVPLDLGDESRFDPVRFLPWMLFEPESIDPDSGFASGVRALVLASAGILEQHREDGPDFRPILVTTDQAGEIGVGRIAFNPEPRRLLANHEAIGTPLAVGAWLTGPAASAFAEPPPEIRDSEDRFRQAENIDVVVIADADLMADQFWVDREAAPLGQRWLETSSNARFLTNILARALDDIDLSALGGRTARERPFDRLIALQQAAEAQYRETELALQTDIAEAERELARLARDVQIDDGQLSAEFLATRAELRQRLVETRVALRAVRVGLQQDVDVLTTQLAILNIAAGP